MTYIFSFVGKYIAYGLGLMIIYLPARAIYVRRRKQKTDLNREFTLALFLFCLTGLLSQTLFPFIRFFNEDEMTLSLFFTSENYMDISSSGITYYNENEIIRSLNLVPFKTIFQYIFGSSEIYAGKDWALNRLINMLGNLVLFFPVGFLLPLVSECFKKLKPALAVGAFISLMIEIIQYFIGRSADVDDVILNILGFFCGYAALNFFVKKLMPLRWR